METHGALEATLNMDDVHDEVEDGVEKMEQDEVEDDDANDVDVEEAEDESVDKDEVGETKIQEDSHEAAKGSEDLTLFGEQGSQTASEHRKQKGVEVFVGGIDKNAKDDDLRAVFDKVGKVMDIRTSRNNRTGKNKGYTFVRYAEPSHAQRAVAELHGKEILGTTCRVSLSEENDSLYVGNINKDWKKDDLMDALQKYKIEKLENVALLEDPHYEGKNRGYGFLEFTTHKNALRALNRLKQRDVVFGGDRTVKVAWAQLLAEPDEETMAKVKIVYVDGLPPAWDEETVKSYFGKYGKIEQTILGRDKASRKRKDYGFIYFSTREEALACIEALNGTEVGEGEQMVVLKVRLSKPVFKSRNAKKGEIHGNHPIGKNADASSRPSGRGGRVQTIERSLAGTTKKLTFPNKQCDSLRGALPVGGRNAVYMTSSFSKPSLHNNMLPRRRTGKFSSPIASNHISQGPELEKLGSNRERGRFESSRRGSFDDRRAGTGKFSSENYHDPREAGRGRKRELSDLEADPWRAGFSEAGGSRARLAHFHDPALAVGGSQYAQTPYYEAPTRAPVGIASQYAAGQGAPLAAQMHGYELHDLHSRATGNTSYGSVLDSYGSTYSNGTEMMRGMSRFPSTYGVPHGTSQFPVSRGHPGPHL